MTRMAAGDLLNLKFDNVTRWVAQADPYLVGTSVKCVGWQQDQEPVLLATAGEQGRNTDDAIVDGNNDCGINRSARDPACDLPR